MAVEIDLSGRAALVTGAGAGIGADIARWLARAGASVAVNDARASHAEAVVADIEAAGGKAITAIADCRDDQQIHSMVDAVVSAFGALDIAVNNIGMTAGHEQGPVDTIPAASWRGIVEQNLILTALCGQAEAAIMKRQLAGGVILNVTSGETTRPSPMMAAYGAAKSAINHLTQTMAVELGPSRIRVIAIAPGTTLTEIVRLRFDEERIAQTVESNPLRRMSDPDELGKLAVFLVSDLAQCITGQMILADAGAHLSRTRPPNQGPAPVKL